MRRIWRRIVLSVVAVAAALVSGCGSSGGGGSAQPLPEPDPLKAGLVVEVTFPGDADKSASASVHAWAVVAKIEGSATCAALIGGALDPYDPSFERRADVATPPASLPAVAPEVLLGPVLVYVEAVDFAGVAKLAGCVPADVIQPSTTVTVTLSKAGVFDCTDPAAEEGSPCDDGTLCTVGEKCSGGSCKGGVARDCTYLADACNAESCDETLGCVAVNLPDTTPCEDGVFCTEGDVCTAGICSGQQKDCSIGAAPCEVAVSCSESQQQCIYDDAPFGTLCDDGNYCTVNDACSSFGSCSGAARDCSPVADQCNTASCDETADQCVPVPKSTVFSCNDGVGCTTSDKCTGTGSCAGTAVSCVSQTDQCNTGMCQEPTGTCAKVPVTNGTVCNDGNPSTINDQCVTGVCTGT
jgi:hypothetical protein